jgi:hypothetical protein
MLAPLTEMVLILDGLSLSEHSVVKAEKKETSLRSRQNALRSVDGNAQMGDTCRQVLRFCLKLKTAV